MTKEITKAFALQQAQGKLGLREWIPEKFLFSETVIPTYNIEQHFENWVTAMKEVSITSATYFLFYTVPENERWVLHRYDIVFMGVAGQIKVTGLYINRKGQSNIYLDMTKAQTTSYHTEIENPVPLNPGDRLNILVDDYTSTQSLRLYLDYMMEEIR